MKNKKRNGNKNKKENLDERPIDGDLFCLTNTTNYYKFRGIIRMCERVAASGGTLTPYSA